MKLFRSITPNITLYWLHLSRQTRGLSFVTSNIFTCTCFGTIPTNYIANTSMKAWVAPLLWCGLRIVFFHLLLTSVCVTVAVLLHSGVTNVHECWRHTTWSKITSVHFVTHCDELYLVPYDVIVSHVINHYSCDLVVDFMGSCNLKRTCFSTSTDSGQMKGVDQRAT